MMPRGGYQRPLTDWHRVRIRNAYQRAGTIRAAATAASVSTSSAHRVLKEAGLLKPSPTPPVYPGSMRAEAVRLYTRKKRPLSTHAISKLFRSRGPGPSPETVHNWMEAEGVVRSKSEANRVMNGEVNDHDYDALERQALQLAAVQLWSARRIARHLGICKTTVLRWLRAAALNRAPSESIKQLAWRAELPAAKARRQKRARVLELTRRGWSYTRIKAATGASRSMIYLYRREAGLTPEPARGHHRGGRT